MLASFIVLLSILVIFLVFYTSEGFIMTFGDYGKQNPASCGEVLPVSGVCNACKLECGIFEYKKNCEECIKIKNKI